MPVAFELADDVHEVFEDARGLAMPPSFVTWPTSRVAGLTLGDPNE